jgi:hypothetical protein
MTDCPEGTLITLKAHKQGEIVDQPESFRRQSPDSKITNMPILMQGPSASYELQ